MLTCENLCARALNCPIVNPNSCNIYVTFNKLQQELNEINERPTVAIVNYVQSTNDKNEAFMLRFSTIKVKKL